MKKMRMCFPREKTFADGFAEYILDCKARNLRDGTIHHYEESIIVYVFLGAVLFVIGWLYNRTKEREKGRPESCFAETK